MCVVGGWGEGGREVNDSWFGRGENKLNRERSIAGSDDVRLKAACYAITIRIPAHIYHGRLQIVPDMDSRLCAVNPSREQAKPVAPPSRQALATPSWRGGSRGGRLCTTKAFRRSVAKSPQGLVIGLRRGRGVEVEGSGCTGQQKILHWL